MSPVTALLAVVFLVMSTTVAQIGPEAVNLRTAGNYTILAETGISTVPSSAITGDIGVSPAAGTTLTGFALTIDSTTTFSTSTQITGKAFSATHGGPTPSILISAISDLETSYLDASGRINPDAVNVATGAIGGSIFTPGLYKWTTGVGVSGDVTIAGTAVDTWIFQIDGSLDFAAGSAVILSGGALAKNIVWVVAGSVTFGSNSHTEGIVLGKTGVTLQTGASLNGRILAQTAVALQMATVVPPPDSVATA